jgi:nucleoside-diphosphate-sugar epimerase
LEALALKVHDNEDITVGSELTARRFVYIDDLVNGILKCANLNIEEIPNKPVNLTGNEIISLGGIIKASNKLLDKKSLFSTELKLPSIRNPLNYYAKNLLKWDPSTSLEAGIQYCLAEMTKNR